jgi:Fe-S-cluster containining protein
MICKRCGKCCLANFSAYVKDEDIRRWQDEDRLDILLFIEKQRAVWAGDHIVLADGSDLKHCMFLRTDGCVCECIIYETRPLTCRNYTPGSSQLCSQYGLKI